MIFYNASQAIGQIVEGITTNMTGGLFLTLLTIVLFLIALCLMFRIPIEFTAIIILPLLLTITAHTTEFLSITGVMLIYLGILFGKMFFAR